MTSQRPNVILLFPDQWRGDCLGVLDHPTVETPHLDQLASEGFLFPNAYTQCPSCIAARASLLTGLTPFSTGRIGYRDGIPWTYEHTMPRLLRDNGYQTLKVGKTHFCPQRSTQGFEEMRTYEAVVRDPGYESDYHAWLRHETNDTVQDTTRMMSSNSWLAHPWEHDERLHCTSWMGQQAVELLKRRDPQRPFFLQVGFHRPHPPIDPPKRYYYMYADRELPPVPVGDWAERFNLPVRHMETNCGHLPAHVLERTRRAYYASMSHIDFEIGRLLLYLRQSGQLDNTWLVFTSDHGELLGDHHRFRKQSGLEGSARIPFFVRPPRSAGLSGGQRRDEPVTLMDLLPTLLEIGGIALPQRMEGSSLMPLLSEAEAPWREWLHGEHAPDCQYVTDGREKFIWDSKTGEELFFDLSVDRQETRNLVNEPGSAERVSLWRQRLVDVLAERGDDALSDGTRLIPGAGTQPVLGWLLEQSR